MDASSNMEHRLVQNPARETQRLLSAIEQAVSQPSKDTEVSSPSSPTSNWSDDIERKSAAAAVVSIPKITQTEIAAPYTECTLHISHRRDLLDISSRELQPLAIEVVRHEGPIHTEEVARRIREAFGLARTGNRILDRIRQALLSSARDGALVREDEFWSIAGSEPMRPRNRRDAANSLRRADRIAPEEYRQAIISFLEASVAASRPELKTNVARLLGFDRMGSDLEVAISAQIDELLTKGEIEEVAGQMRLVHATN